MKNVEISNLISKNNNQRNKILDLTIEINHQQEIINKQNQKINEFETSRSWKITNPLRKITSKLNRNKTKKIE